MARTNLQRWSQLLNWIRNAREGFRPEPRHTDFTSALRPFLSQNMDYKTSIKKPFTVVVEGNIGSGKTTFLNYFRKYSDVEVLEEPVDKWRNVHGHNLLSLLYEDPTRWSLTFQTHVQQTKLENHVKESNARVKLMERSVFSGFYCFVENLHQSQLMQPAEYAVLSEWFKWITRHIDVSVDLIVYLRTDPEVAYKRIIGRARKEEKTLPFSYIQDLHNIHDAWLRERITHPVPAPVLEIDANVELPKMFEQISQLETQILNQKPRSSPFKAERSPSKLIPPVSPNVTVVE